MNPREVKRLVNAYTMQMKMLERKLKDQPRAASAPAVLALQVMSFRADWQTTYQALSNNPSDFVDAARDALNRGSSAIAMAEEVIELPPSLVSYLRNEGAPLLDLGDDLEVYVSTLDAAQSTDPSVRELAQVLGRLRVAHKQAQAPTAGSVRDLLTEVVERFARLSYSDPARRPPSAPGSFKRRSRPRPVRRGERAARHRAHAQQTALVDAWLADVGRELSPLGQSLTDLRRRTQTGGTPSP